MNMNRKTQKIVSLLLLPLLFAVLLIPGRASAKESACKISIPAEVEVSGKNIPEGMEYKLTLKAVSEEAPMPGKTGVTIEDEGKAEFGPITYTVPGDYVYEVSQKAGTKEHFTYDKKIYTVTVRVVNDGNGGLKAEIWAVKDGSRNKTDSITFKNKYTAPSNSGESGHRHSGSSSGTSADPQSVLSLLAPQTGDTSGLILWASLLAAALLGLIAMGVIRRRRREEA